MNPIEQLEHKIAEYFGAPYAVAVDCCTHGIELCLRLHDEGDPDFPYQFTCPPHTYLSVPMTFEKLNLDWHFVDNRWEKYYTIGNTNIIDAAVLWEQNSYIPSSLMCISFQLKKHLSLGKGFGYHYQMTYETAQLGLEKFDDAVHRTPRHWTYKDYPNLSQYEIFQKGVLH